MRRVWRDYRELELSLGASISVHRWADQDARMSGGTQTSEVFLCPKCGLAFRAIRGQFPDKRAGRFECIDCRTEVHSWSGVYDYIG
jgi:predicted RNA-binding Zn-ribbon protein involved in translation (DUF1610 family)